MKAVFVTLFAVLGYVLCQGEQLPRHDPSLNRIVKCPPRHISRPPITKRQKLESPRITNWGSWGDWADCGGDSFVIGMQLKTQAEQGDKDDTALNAIRLTCSAPNSNDQHEIQSLEGKLGSLGSNFRCPGNRPAIGFQLRSLKNQGGGDDTAANNFRLICENETLEGDGLSAGEWSESQTCKNDEALCGFRTEVESPGGDETSLNNIDMVCCSRS